MCQLLGILSFRRSIVNAAFQSNKSHLLRTVPGLLNKLRYHETKIAACKHSITYKPYTPLCYTDHDHKNMELKRPMSPHLTVYAPTLPAMTSIAQRATGSILSFYALMLSMGTLFLPNGLESYVYMFQSLNLGFLSIILLKLILGAPFVYHYFNGIRYAAWNAAKFLTIKEVYETARKALVAAAIVTVLFSLI